MAHIDPHDGHSPAGADSVKRLILVNGTGDYQPQEYATDRWWKSGSAFTALLQDAGYTPVIRTKAGIEVPPWSGKLDGTFWSGKAERSWYHAGESRLASDLLKLPQTQRWMIVWSHGLQPAVLAAGTLARMDPPERIAGLISICSPLRRGLAAEYAAVVAAVPWRHIYTTNIFSNRMQWMGARMAKWEMPGADNKRMKGIGHGELLLDPETHRDLVQTGILDFLDAHYT
jgi:hypothetical protein